MSLFLCSNCADFLISVARARAHDLWVMAYCLVLMNRLVELPVDKEKLVHLDFALEWEFAARSMSGSSKAQAREALATSDISIVDFPRGVPPLVLLSSMSLLSSDPSSLSILSRKSLSLANCVVTVPEVSSNVD